MKNFDKTQLINRKRTFSRLVAAQSLYQFEFGEKKGDVQDLKDDLIKNYILFEEDEVKSYETKIDNIFVDRLIEEATAIFVEIDADIEEYRKNDELDILVQQIIRLGATELKVFTDTDFKVIIDEYCDIASFFYEDSKIAFISSILNKLSEKYNRK